MEYKRIIAVDFDGTIVKHEFPEIGAPIPGAVEVLKELVDEGRSLILYTMRPGKFLEDAKEYVENTGIHFVAFNHNPLQSRWTTSPKVYAHHYIDDNAIGCPLIKEPGTERPYVNWQFVRQNLVRLGCFPKEG